MNGTRVDFPMTSKTVYQLVDDSGDTLIVHAYDDGDVIIEIDDKMVWLKAPQVVELRKCLAPIEAAG